MSFFTSEVQNNVRLTTHPDIIQPLQDIVYKNKTFNHAKVDSEEQIKADQSLEWK